MSQLRVTGLGASLGGRSVLEGVDLEVVDLVAGVNGELDRVVELGTGHVSIHLEQDDLVGRGDDGDGHIGLTVVVLLLVQVQEDLAVRLEVAVDGQGAHVVEGPVDPVVCPRLPHDLGQGPPPGVDVDLNAPDPGERHGDRARVTH